ncbi:hypothetical protein [Wenzhouxiangella sp. EGI_FJ10305]|uniref:hypothetical protein n=1 Tax=Wenzhouxiangella sp. EGI_FJ10305 TaxID=3243768 RepID=UPI0035D62A00
MSFDSGTLLLLALVVPTGLFLLWQLLRLGRRADAVFRGRSMSVGQKRFWIALLLLGALIAISGAWLVGLEISVGWHIGGLGIAWFLSGLWIPAYHEEELMNGVREGAQGMCAFATLTMFVGIGLALFCPSEPIVGTGSWADVVTFAGLALHLSGLWVIAPGPGGIAVG